MHGKRLGLAGLGWLLLAMSALRAETTFTNRVAFEAALPGSMVVDTFTTDIPNGASIVFASAVMSDGTVPLGTPINEVTGGAWSTKIRNFTAGVDGYQTITWTFPGPTNAVGVDWSSLSSTRGVTITADWDGSGDEAIVLFDQIGASNGFFGVIGTSTFTEVRLTATGTGDNDIFGADGLTFDDGTPVELLSFAVE